MSIFQNFFGNKQAIDLQSIIEKGAFLVDVREPGEYAGGTAKGAVNIPLGRIAAELKKFQGKENIVVFCRSGNRSAQAKAILEQNGFKNVVNGGTLDDVRQFAK